MPTLPSMMGTKSRSSCEAVSYRRMLTRQGYRRVDHARASRLPFAQFRPVCSVQAGFRRRIRAPERPELSKGQVVTRDSGRGEHDCGGDGGNALAAAGESEPVSGRRRDRYRCRHDSAQHGLGLFTTRSEPGAVADDLDGDVADGEAGAPGVELLEQ